MENRAVLLDRDGVINELLYDRQNDISESPSNPREFHLLPGVGDAIHLLNRSGFKVIVVSNQPDIAKGRITQETFELIRRKMVRLITRRGGKIDGEFYCFHHPRAALTKYRKRCSCRKPKPGLITRAAREFNFSPKRSYMVGDRPTDILAGRAAGCKTVWLNDMKCEYCTIMRSMHLQPDLIFANLSQAAKHIADH